LVVYVVADDAGGVADCAAAGDIQDRVAIEAEVEVGVVGLL
jgi:hypothetical protein